VNILKFKFAYFGVAPELARVSSYAEKQLGLFDYSGSYGDALSNSFGA